MFSNLPPTRKVTPTATDIIEQVINVDLRLEHMAFWRAGEWWDGTLFAILSTNVYQGPGQI
jgi:hypothetical protein